MGTESTKLVTLQATRRQGLVYMDMFSISVENQLLEEAKG